MISIFILQFKKFLPTLKNNKISPKANPSGIRTEYIFIFCFLERQKQIYILLSMYRVKITVYGIKRKTIYLQNFSMVIKHSVITKIEPTCLNIEKSVGPMRIGYFIQV